MNRIRKVCEYDVDRLQSFVKKAGLPEIKGDMKENCFFILENEEEWHGCIGLKSKDEQGLIFNLVISPQMGQKEIIALFDQVVREALDQHLSTIYLYAGSKQAIPLLQLLGFDECSREESPSFVRNYQQDIGAILMKRTF
ncbi:MAG TPA: hypothetical protein VEY51_19540 [Chondromyces sp.]|nr:hypothetical protein [Chondromyces sp.]